MSDQITQHEDITEVLRVRREKLAELRSTGKDPYLSTSYNKTHSSTEILEDFEELEGKEVSIAGRIISKRIMGKASFFHLMDGSGKIQVYARRDVMGDEPYAEYKHMDIGDIVGIQGEVFKTNAGEVSVKSHSITLLSKSLQPLPEKWHGLKDTDLRYRQRYVDLIVNPDVKQTFYMRSQIMKCIRDFLDNKGYIEVETPILQSSAGGAAARPFITFHNTLDINMYLRIATELHLKRLIVGGFEKVYEIGRIFRNEGMSPKHNPEFTTVELYEAYTDYKGMMDLCEGLFLYCAKEVLKTEVITYQEQEINLQAPWKRLTMLDAVKEYAGIDFSICDDDDKARAAAKAGGIHFEGQLTKGELLNEAFEQKVEEQLIQPTFICDYPVEVSPLAKKKADEDWLTERFELYITGREFANAFSELNDPDDQKQRFLEQVSKREKGDEEANMMDDDFINALEYAMPPTGGMGIGIDRMIMLLTDRFSIRDVLLFPTMKPR